MHEQITEVRRCRRCGADAVVCVRSWAGIEFFSGLPEGVARRDFAG